MAFVTTGFFLDVTLVDYGANETHKSWEMTAANAAAAVTDAATVVAALEAVTDAEAISYSIRQNYIEDTFVAPTIVNPVSVVASITALIDGAGNKKANLSIPSPSITIFQDTTGDAADLVDGAAVATYLALFQTGGELLISDGEVLGDFLRGIRVTQKRRLSGGN